LEAIIYKSTGSWYQCKTRDGRFWNARTKGKFKMDKEITTTNPIAVGDIVDVALEDELENSLMITGIHARKNYLIRSSPHSRFQFHIVASNLDQSIIIATIKDPRTSTGFIDRYLVSCEVYHIPAIIVLNKIDLHNEEDMAYVEHVQTMYTDIGYPVYQIAATEGIGIDAVKSLLKDKVTLLTGHSGVGKSTLINTLIPVKDIKVQEVSGWSGKGMHTTTFAEMHDLPEGGQLIDTPGIRELGIVRVKRAELGGYFPEIRRASAHCKYNNCLHINEPGCAVMDAVNVGSITEDRYISYRKIYDSINDKTY
jgi:ribosome biogenesis GTPase